jgi:hypothetical protein
MRTTTSLNGPINYEIINDEIIGCRADARARDNVRIFLQLTS